jgi:chondroitin 4-sulfotransferase 11
MKKYKIIKILKIMKIYKILRFILRKLRNNHFTENNILIEKYNAIYFPIQKVACSSIKSKMRELLNIDIDNKLNTTHHNKEDKEAHNIPFPYIKRKDIWKYKDYIKFAFVRNPYDRLVSCYKNRIKDKPINNKPFVNWVYENFLHTWNFYYWMSFKDFVYEISNINEDDSESHFKSQYTFLINKNWKLIPDFIWKFENLEHDFEKICKLIWVKWMKLPHLMKSKHKNYREYYDDETKKLVSERYKKDLKLFDYEF